MPARITLILLAFTAVTLAQAQGPPSSACCNRGSSTEPQQACNCPMLKLEPFTGHVLDAATGKPIAGAEVHYLDDNPPIDRNNRPVRGIISGTVTTEADGSYKLPTDLPLATFRIRVTAPGYYGGRFYDSQHIVGMHLPASFPQPSHEVRLKSSFGLVAIGASQLPGAVNHRDMIDFPVTAAALASGANSLVVAAPGPRLWLITLPDGHVRPIDLPAQVTAPGISIGSLGWDGEHLVFVAGDDTHSFIAGGSAPDLRLALLPAPNPQQVSLSFGIPGQGIDNFDIEETSGCDIPNAGPHCGQGGSIVARNRDTGRATEVFSAPVDDLSYLHDPMLGGLIAFAEDTEPAVPPIPFNSEDREIPGITLLNLTTHQRTHIDIPGRFGRHPTMVAEHMVSEVGAGFNAMRLAYTVDGDCDPNSTDKSQPSTPAGGIGYTDNNWSVCVVTIPVPPEPKASSRPHPPSAQKR